MFAKSPPRKVNPTDTKVLRFILRNFNSNGLFTMTPREVAEAMGFPQRTVERAFQRLAALEILVPEAHNRTTAGHKAATAYRVTAPVGVVMPNALRWDLDNAAQKPTATSIHTVAAMSVSSGMGVAVGEPTATSTYKVGSTSPNTPNKSPDKPIGLQTDRTGEIPHNTYVGVVGPEAYKLEDFKQRLAKMREMAVKYPKEWLWEDMAQKLEKKVKELEAVCMN